MGEGLVLFFTFLLILNFPHGTHTWCRWGGMVNVCRAGTYPATWLSPHPLPGGWILDLIRFGLDSIFCGQPGGLCPVVCCSMWARESIRGNANSGIQKMRTNPPIIAGQKASLNVNCGYVHLEQEIDEGEPLERGKCQFCRDSV